MQEASAMLAGGSGGWRWCTDAGLIWPVECQQAVSVDADRHITPALCA
jgi:hypothetical protein